MIGEERRSLEDWTFAEMREALELALDLVERMREMEADEWLTHDEAAARLKRTPGALHKLAAKGEIPRSKVSDKKYLYSRKELDEYLHSKKESR